jgi:hypothetical protein
MAEAVRLFEDDEEVDSYIPQNSARRFRGGVTARHGVVSRK